MVRGRHSALVAGGYTPKVSLHNTRHRLNAVSQSERQEHGIITFWEVNIRDVWSGFTHLHEGQLHSFECVLGFTLKSDNPNLRKN